MDKETDIFSHPAAFFPWQPAAWLRVTGEDAFTFLQGQFTNDLRALQAVPAVYGLWLNHKGRVVADSFVVKGSSGEFWVGSYFVSASVIIERLMSFIIADDVVVENLTAQWRAATVFDLATEARLTEIPGVLSFPGRRTAAPHREYVFPAELESVVRVQLASLTELGAKDMERKRITAGIPAIPLDLSIGELPNEGRLETSALSYTKGCYLGQEVMARLKSMGQVRRRLLRVEGSGDIPIMPAALHQGERRIGELRTAVPTNTGFQGMALLSLLHLRPDDGLSLRPGEELAVKVIETP